MTWYSMVTRLTPIYTTLPARIIVDRDGPSHFELEAHIRRNLTLTLKRVADGRPVKGARLFRRYADDDPGEWLVSRWIGGDPVSGGWSSVSSETGEFPLHTLAAGTHRIYIPTLAAQQSWPKGPGWSHLSGPDDLRAERLVFIGTINVTEHDQTFELRVPSHIGW